MSGAARDPRVDAEAHIEATPTTAFGKYQLFASLGRGGMADVFLSVARGQMGFNKLAVIKRLRQALAEEPAFRNMFLDEARLAARLSHPNIVHTYEVGEQGGVYFIAMEYLEGQSLNKVLKEAHRRKEPLDPQFCARVVADALAGLHYAHELRDYDGRPLGVIHRDVSPHNVFVTYDGHTKLVDFGIAKAALSSTETEVGVLKGKVAYMSPEQAMGSRIDARSDLFPMGIVLWELVTGQRLMTGDNAANTLHRLMNEPIPLLSRVVPGTDSGLERIVARALEKEPARRFQSAAEMREALESWLSNQRRPMRQEDVGQVMMHLFSNVREEVQRQIQRHMAAITAATNTAELQALNAEALQRIERSSQNISGQLLRLGVASGSGSGVVPSYGLGHPSQYPSIGSGSSMAAPPPPKTSNTMLIVVAIGCFLIAAALIVVIGLRDRRAKETAGQVDPPNELVPVPVAPPGTSASTAPVSAPVETAVVVTTPPPPPQNTTENTTAKLSVKPTSTRERDRPGAKPQPAPAAANPAEKEEPGYLTVSSYPWAKVTVGTRVICAATPCTKVPLSPGQHTLVFENAEKGLKQAIPVVVKSGEETKKTVGLQ